MAAHTPAFSPDEAQRIVGRLQQPAVFLKMTHGWPVLHWTAENLRERLGDRTVRFRLGRKGETNAPLFETQCPYVEAKMAHFLSWVKGEAGEDVGPFCDYSSSEYWAYADYKYIAMLFADQPAMFEDVKWEVFGLEGRNGKESTLWVGSEGANTPCHLDSYGCNLVLQVQGRKRWHLFPPEDTSKLYPTRIPYEESSVFSRVDVLHPDLKRFPAFRSARAHTVTLQPGQVLYVPRHWWHYVESVDPITVSVNSWIELDDDYAARVGEAVTKTVVCALKSGENTDDWLNPTEECVPSHNENMHYIDLAVRACVQRRRTNQVNSDARTAKRDSSGQIRRCDLEAVPFGPCLLAVRHVPDDHGRASPRTHGDHDGKTSETITTDDLLECLLHPDVITRVTELLLDKQRTPSLQQ
uniref:HSPB1-associated protein 1 homolog n=1 Tax=Doryrhamphus excisus TaxID=161450 RepID=UPI0025AEA2ED|nr:HSPB1-associated protein 1 homolog [Doryrhamphus excisus]XP_057937952.1 HSPB1-associated protein 1 homolog [Doryrhamphus excisus]